MTKGPLEEWYHSSVRLMYYVVYGQLKNREQVEDAMKQLRKEC